MPSLVGTVCKGMHPSGQTFSEFSQEVSLDRLPLSGKMGGYQQRYHPHLQPYGEEAQSP